MLPPSPISKTNAILNQKKAISVPRTLHRTFPQTNVLYLVRNCAEFFTRCQLREIRKIWNCRCRELWAKGQGHWPLAVNCSEIRGFCCIRSGWKWTTPRTASGQRITYLATRSPFLSHKVKWLSQGQQSFPPTPTSLELPGDPDFIEDNPRQTDCPKNYALFGSFLTKL